MKRRVDWRRLVRHPVTVALALLVVELAYRAWAVSRSGWLGDDFVMIDRTYAHGGHSLTGMLGSYAGHVIPGTLYLTWLITQLAPYQFFWAAAAMLLMQLLAALGLLRFLVVAFGPRWGIVPPFLLYLVSPFLVQSTVWWTPGSHHFMLQAALGWSMASQVTYLRTRRRRSALAAVLWVIVGLVFFEKTLLVTGALGFLTIAYFTEGSARERLRQVWERYRFSLVANVCLGVAYLALYVHYGLTFSPNGAVRHPLGPVAEVMILRSWSTGIFGGPLTWRNGDAGPVSFADPAPLLVVLSLVCLASILRALARSRTHSLRSLLLPAFFLICDVVLVGAGRANFIGPDIGFEFRYLSELSMVTAMALALATMPITGALVQVEVKRSSALDRPKVVTFACLLVALLATYSTLTYVHHWDRGRQPSAAWVGNLFHDARALPEGAHVIDAPAPEYVAWPISRPANLVSHLVRPIRTDLRYDGVSSRTMRVVDAKGHIRAARLTRLRWVADAPHRRCPYRVARTSRRIALNDRVGFPGLWVRVSYVATGNSAVTVSAGGAAHRTSVRPGLHVLYFRAGEQPFDTIKIGGLLGGTELCTDDVVVGQPIPREGT